MSAHMLQYENHCTDFDQIWYENDAIECQPNLIPFNFLQSVRTRWTCKLMRCHLIQDSEINNNNIQQIELLVSCLNNNKIIINSNNKRICSNHYQLKYIIRAITIRLIVNSLDPNNCHMNCVCMYQ